MNVTVIVVNYNAGDLLKKCVDALAAQTYRNFNVIVVDNGSQDQSVRNLGTLPAAIRIIAAGKNLGFAAANNLAARECDGEWIATLNPDASPEADWLEKLMDATRRYPSVDMFGSTQLNGADPAVLDGTGDAYHAFGYPWRCNFGRSIRFLPPEGEVFGPCAAAALYRRGAFLAASGFDEKFFCYCEDVDLAFRLRLQGHRCVQVHDAVVHHMGSAIAGRYSAFTIYHGARNRFWTFVKNTPGPLLAILLPLHLVLHVYLLVRAMQRGHGRPLARATLDMFTGLPAILRDRKAVQRARKVPAMAVAKSMAWSLLKLKRRGDDSRKFIE